MDMKKIDMPARNNIINDTEVKKKTRLLDFINSAARKQEAGNTVINQIGKLGLGNTPILQRRETASDIRWVIQLGLKASKFILYPASASTH